MYYIDHEEVKAVEKVISEQSFFRYRAEGLGECENFEKEFAKSLGAEHAQMVTSGTNALMAALKACGVQPGDEVLIPCYTFVATAVSVINVGAIPVLCNIDESLSLCVNDIKLKLTPKTKAIIPVHMDGLNCKMDDICAIAKEKNLIVIEDVAQALGGKYQGKYLGTWGDIGCFSFNQDKVLSCGEGGACITNDRILYERLLCIHDTSSLFNPIYKNKFKNIKPFMGMSMRVSEISGAIMRIQLKRLEKIQKELRQRQDIFKKTLLIH